MAIDYQTDTFRAFGRIGRISSQTAVECRFGGEVETVLSVTVSPVLSGGEAGNGEVKYYGKAVFCIVYEDADKRICRAEKGVEFAARAIDESVFPAMTPRIALTVENTSVRREGASVYVTALIGADVSLFGEQTFEYVSGGDLVCRRDPTSVLVSHLCGGETEAQDEFETDFIGDILTHHETVNVTDLNYQAGTLRLEGEINLNVLALKGESGVVSFERLIPFSAEIACEDVGVGCSAEADVSVTKISLHAETDEENAKSTLFAELVLSVRACVYEELPVDGVTDAFSTHKRISLSYGEIKGCGAGNIERRTERISGKAALSSEIDFSDTLQAVTLQRAEGNLVGSGDNKRIEGVAMATIIVLGADGCHRGVEMSLPFSLPYAGEGGKVSLFACGASARQRQEGEIDADVTLKICIAQEKHCSAKLVSAVREGEDVAQSDSAVSVYIPKAGDGLWELSKRLNKTPEEVAANNPELEFPIREGQRVIIYRKKTV